MRRSSCIVLCIAFVFLIAATFLYMRSFNSTAPPMTDAEASRIIARGNRSLERKDVRAIVDMMSPDAKILNRSLPEVEEFIRTAVGQVNGHLSVAPRNIHAHPAGAQADFTFDMDVGQKSQKLDAVYFPNIHVTVQLEKRRTTHWLGLVSKEEWKITQVDTVPVIDTPPG